MAKITLGKSLDMVLKKEIEQATKDTFDEVEIQSYIVMSLEEYMMYERPLKKMESFKKWLRMKVLSYAYLAFSMNSKKATLSKLFHKKYDYYRNKSYKMLEDEGMKVSR
jgi:hypothetical protein